VGRFEEEGGEGKEAVGTMGLEEEDSEKRDVGMWWNDRWEASCLVGEHPFPTFDSCIC
jgi:hypothetical protein